MEINLDDIELPDPNKKTDLSNKQDKQKRPLFKDDSDPTEMMLSEAAFNEEYDNRKRRIARANSFKYIRLKRNMDQKQMAELLGCSLAMYKKFETAANDVNMKTMDRWLHRLGEGYLTIAY